MQKAQKLSDLARTLANLHHITPPNKPTASPPPHSKKSHTSQPDKTKTTTSNNSQLNPKELSKPIKRKAQTNLDAAYTLPTTSTPTSPKQTPQSPTSPRPTPPPSGPYKRQNCEINKGSNKGKQFEEATLLNKPPRTSRKRKSTSTFEPTPCASITSTSSKKQRQNILNKNNEGKTDCPFLHDSPTKTLNTDVNQAANDSKLKIKQNKSKLPKSKVPKTTKHNKTVFFNPLLGLDNSSPSELIHDNQIVQHNPMVSISNTQIPIQTRPNPQSTILASQNFPPYPPDPGVPSQLNSL